MLHAVGLSLSKARAVVEVALDVNIWSDKLFGVLLLDGRFGLGKGQILQFERVEVYRLVGAVEYLHVLANNG